LLNKSFRLAAAPGATKFSTVCNMILVPLCYSNSVIVRCWTSPPQRWFLEHCSGTWEGQQSV